MIYINERRHQLFALFGQEFQLGVQLLNERPIRNSERAPLKVHTVNTIFNDFELLRGVGVFFLLNSSPSRLVSCVSLQQRRQLHLV